ncbi:MULTISPECIES: nucleotidyltransferase domain-containing protein [unclassified Vibrio]|uniref:Nucleotidyltransferase domain-containing protein n=1 Tax=Vibrio sp. HB236076 TaxID=3232307 RepID=A0AB39HC00_9VIBR|nr:nucleotidyltransferase domain-containing protein [Vibrio sp. HB161653]MDP5253538.1 nucleotidyltransferase domain-containing protein [Vibrio sp. HB161653]
MYLSKFSPSSPYQAEFQAAMEMVISFLQSELGEQIHSLYLYGSVARGCAKPGRSNLDMVMVLNRSLGTKQSTLLNTLRWHLQRRHPQVNGLSLKIAQLDQVASLEGVLNWGFLLRHCSTCVYGEDLAECFGDYQPSWEIAKFWNMDLEQWLVHHRRKMAEANDPASLLNTQYQVAKKLLRAAYSLVMHKDQQWFDEPLDCARAFLSYHPEQEVMIKRLILLYLQKPVAKRSSIAIIDQFGQWLGKQYQKTEFRIG